MKKSWRLMGLKNRFVLAAAAILVDCAGPASLAVEGELLDQLADGHRLVETSAGEFGWVVRTREQRPE